MTGFATEQDERDFSPVEELSKARRIVEDALPGCQPPNMKPPGIPTAPPKPLTHFRANFTASGGLAQWPEADPHGFDPHAPGAKLDSGKQIAGVLLDFSRALEAVADVGTFGANKYTRGGWQTVPQGEQRYMDALMRHLLKMQREDLDPDSGLEHLAHLAWNALAVLELRRRAA